MHLQYATISEYFDAVNTADVTFPVHGPSDFFPYHKNCITFPTAVVMSSCHFPRKWVGGLDISLHGLYIKDSFGMLVRACITVLISLHQSRRYRADTTIAFFGGDTDDLEDLRRNQALSQHR